MTKKELDTYYEAFNRLMKTPIEEVVSFGTQKKGIKLNAEDALLLEPFLKGMRECEYTIGKIKLKATAPLSLGMIKECSDDGRFLKGWVVLPDEPGNMMKWRAAFADMFAIVCELYKGIKIADLQDDELTI